MHRVQTSDKIVILGCGCFGASAAFHLMQRGYANVTVLDKSATLPAPDAASNDINRIVRSSYNDKFYAELARHAILSWKNVEEWDDTYHESGVVVLGFPLTDSKDGGTDTSATPEREIPYAEAAYLNDLDLGARVSLLRSNSKEDFQSVFPAGVSVTSRGLPASFRNRAGYFNRDGGWVNAGKGLAMIIEKVKKLGGNVVPGKEARNIIVDPGKCKKVVCADGTEYEADIVIIATGSWTPSTFPELFKDSCLATGQCVAMIELTPEEAARCKDCPVVLDFETGFYVFPPNQDRIMKMAIHAAGYTNTVAGISTPRTLTSDPTDGLSIPMEAMAKLREGLDFGRAYANRYNDSPDGDWIISKYPNVEGLFVATAGSGHAYKFLPVIGCLTADLLENKLEPSIVNKLSLGRTMAQKDASRTGLTQEIDVTTLWQPMTKL